MTGTPRMDTWIGLPSLRRRTASRAIFWPLATASVMALASAAISPGATRSSTRRPTTSWRLKPNIRENSPLTRMIRPTLSEITMASGISWNSFSK